MVTDTQMVVDHTKHHRSLDGTGGSSMVALGEHRIRQVSPMLSVRLGVTQTLCHYILPQPLPGILTVPPFLGQLEGPLGHANSPNSPRHGQESYDPTPRIARSNA